MGRSFLDSVVSFLMSYTSPVVRSRIPPALFHGLQFTFNPIDMQATQAEFQASDFKLYFKSLPSPPFQVDIRLDSGAGIGLAHQQAEFAAVTGSLFLGDMFDAARDPPKR